jgi:hypothetical protein
LFEAGIVAESFGVVKGVFDFFWGLLIFFDFWGFGGLFA